MMRKFGVKRKIGVCASLIMMCMLSFSATLAFAQSAVLEVKDVQMSVGVHENKPNYDITVNMATAFSADGVTGIHLTDESIKTKIKINGKTIGEITDWNRKSDEARTDSGVVQIHRFQMLKIYIYDSMGYLPCSVAEHLNVRTCVCAKRAVLLNDGTDEIKFLGGLTTGGLIASGSDVMLGLKHNIWWKDGIVIAPTRGWNAVQDTGCDIGEIYDFNKAPKLPFLAQKMTSGTAEFFEKLDAEQGINLRFSQLSANNIVFNLLNRDSEGIKVVFSTDAGYAETKIKLEYMFEDKDSTGATLNNPWEVTMPGGWHWYTDNSEWTTHSIQIRRIDGFMCVFVNNIQAPILAGASVFHRLEMSELSARVSSIAPAGGTVWLGEVLGGNIDRPLGLVNITDANFPSATFDVSFKLNFDSDIGANKDFAQRQDYFIQNYLLINGKTVNELNASNINNVQIHRRSKHFEVYVLKGAIFSGSEAQQELSIKIKKGFATNIGGVFNNEVVYYYNYDYNDWYPIADFRQTDVNLVEYLAGVDNGGLAFQVAFSDVPSDKDILNIAKTKAVSEGIKINGKTVKELNEIQANSVDGHWYQGRLHMYVYTTPANGGLDKTKDNTIEFLPELVTPNGERISNAQTFVYKKGYGGINGANCWVEDVDTSSVEYDKLEIVSVSEPMQDINSGNMLFYLDFNMPLTDRARVFMQGDAWWLQAAGIYNADTIRVLHMTGIFESIRENIIFNGKSVQEMYSAETNGGFQQTAIMVHIGDGSLNRITFAVGGTYDGKPLNDDKSNKSVNMVESADENFRFEIKSGFKSLLGGKTQQDIEYNYNHISKQWTKTGDVAVGDSAVVTYAGYNGYKIVKDVVIKVRQSSVFDEKLLFLEFEDKAATYELIGNKELAVGKNEFVIKTTSSTGDKVTELRFFIEREDVEAKGNGCGSIMVADGAIGTLACILTVLVPIMLLFRLISRPKKTGGKSL